MAGESANPARQCTTNETRVIMLLRLNHLMENFFSWWRDGLKLLVPEFLRGAYAAGSVRIEVELTRDGWVISIVEGQGRAHRDGVSISSIIDSDKERITSWLVTLNADGAPVTLIIPAGRILRRALSLPAASPRDLREMARLELERQTPFFEDQVYFCYHIRGRSKDANRYMGELVVCRREDVDPMLAQLDRLGLDPASVSERGRGVEYPLLPRRAHLRPTLFRQKRTGVLAALAGCLLIAVLYLPVILQGITIARSEDRLAKLKSQAEQVVKLRGELRLLQERQQALDTSGIGEVTAIGVLAELSNRMPDNAWVNRLVYQDGEVNLQGQSDAAADIIPILEQSPLFEAVQLRSPITRSDATRRDVFQITAKVVTAP